MWQIGVMELRSIPGWSGNEFSVFLSAHSKDGTLTCQGVDSLLCELRDDVDLVVADSLGEERSDGLTVERSAGEGGAVGVAELELEGSK